MCTLCDSKGLVNIWLAIYILTTIRVYLDHSLPRKLWSNADFTPQNYGPMQTLPRKFVEHSFFAPQNNGAMQTLLREIKEPL